MRAAKVNDGEELIKLSLIFNLTINPANINKNNPEDANNSINWLKYKPINKPPAPKSWRKPVSFLNLGNLYLSNSEIMNFE